MRLFLPFMFLLVLVCSSASATHLIGAEFYYTHITGNTYKINLILYGDCASNSNAFPNLYSAHPKIYLYHKQNGNMNLFSSPTLNIESPIGQEITPLCPSELANSSCNGGSLPGIRKFLYSTIVNLPSVNGNQYREWEFQFNGQQDVSNPNNLVNAGRTTIITNLVLNTSGTNLTGPILNLKAYLNRSQGENSSPSFTSSPTPFYCINKPQTYNIGAVDMPSDILSFQLVPGLTNNCQSNVNYISGYSGSSPLATSGTPTFNTVSGQYNFTPNQVQNSVVVYEVTETRNGVLIGTSMREMIFVVLNNCNNSAPTDSIKVSAPGNLLSEKIQICAGNPLHVDFYGYDIDNNNISVTYNNLPPGANFTTSANNTQHPVSTLNWNNTIAGNYLFYLTYLDDGCPIASKQEVAYSINVITLQDPIVSVIEPTHCVQKAAIKIDLPDLSSYAPVNVVIKNATGLVVKTYSNITTSPILDSLPVGNYTIQTINSLINCSSNIVSFNIVDSGTFPYMPSVISPVFYCIYDTPVPLIAQSNPSNYPTIMKWYDNSGTALSGTPIPSTNIVGTQYFNVTQTYNVCTSLPSPVIVKVTIPPNSNFLIPPKVCQYDTFLVKYIGPYADSNNVKIVWDLGLAIMVDSGKVFGEIYVTYPIAGNFSLGISSISESECSGVGQSKNIQVLPSAITRLSGDTSICQYETLSLSNTMPIFSGATYTWSAPDGIIQYQSNALLQVTYNTPGLKTITLTAQDTNCAYTSYHYVMVYPKPTISLNIDQNTQLCLGDTIIFRVDSGVKIEFFPASYIVEDNDTANKFYLPVLYPIQITGISTGTGGCKDTAALNINNIKDCCHYLIPNAFTPNNDGDNDEFQIWFAGNPKRFELTIFNRYGQKVFYSPDKYHQWDGTINGNKVDLGTYFYMLNGECYEGKKFLEKGDILLIR